MRSSVCCLWVFLSPLSQSACQQPFLVAASLLISSSLLPYFATFNVLVLKNQRLEGLELLIIPGVSVEYPVGGMYDLNRRTMRHLFCIFTYLFSYICLDGTSIMAFYRLIYLFIPSLFIYFFA